MKERWKDEQVKQYEDMTDKSLDALKKRMIKDLREAIMWIGDEDFESAYRFSGGVSEFLYKYQLELINKRIK